MVAEQICTSRNEENIGGQGSWEQSQGRDGVGSRDVSSYLTDDKPFYLLEMCGWAEVTGLLVLLIFLLSSITFLYTPILRFHILARSLLFCSVVNWVLRCVRKIEALLK